MKIFINDEAIDYTLEDEKTLGDVFDSLRDWLNSQGFGIASVIEGDRELLQEEKGVWAVKPVTDVGEIQMAVKPLAELSFDKLQTLHQYLLLLVKGIEKENIPLLNDLVGEYDSIEKHLISLFSWGMEKRDRGDISLLRALITESGIGKDAIENRDALYQTRKLCNAFLVLIEERIRELTEPGDELKATIALLSQSIPSINNIPILLQTGKDREAMSTVILFTELSQKLIRLYPILKMNRGFDMQRTLSTGQTLEEFYTDFNAILSELNEAFQAKDSVLIGDLLEYEISPRVENLVSMSKDL